MISLLIVLERLGSNGVSVVVTPQTSFRPIHTYIYSFSVLFLKFPISIEGCWTMTNPGTCRVQLPEQVDLGAQGKIIKTKTMRTRTVQHFGFINEQIQA